MEMISNESLGQEVLINSWLTAQVKLHGGLQPLGIELGGYEHMY